MGWRSGGDSDRTAGLPLSGRGPSGEDPRGRGCVAGVGAGVAAQMAGRGVRGCGGGMRGRAAGGDVGGRLRGWGARSRPRGWARWTKRSAGFRLRPGGRYAGRVLGWGYARWEDAATGLAPPLLSCSSRSSTRAFLAHTLAPVPLPLTSPRPHPFR